MTKAMITSPICGLVLAFACNAGRPGAMDGSETGGDGSGSSGATDLTATAETDGTTTSSGSESSTETDTADGTTDETTGDTGDSSACPDGVPSLVLQMDETIYAGEAADLAVLAGIVCLDGGLDISQAVTSVESLVDLEIITRGLVVGGDGAELKLASLAGLEHLRIVGGDAWIRAKSLPNLDGLNGLEEVGASLMLDGVVLDDVDALAKLQRVGGVLGLGGFNENSGSIVDIGGLSGLQDVGAIDISHLDGLTSLNGLQSVALIGDQVVIGPCQDLVDVTPLGGGEPVVVPGMLSITGNPKLPTCNAQALADTLDVQGQSVLAGNLPDACGG